MFIKVTYCLKMWIDAIGQRRKQMMWSAVRCVQPNSKWCEVLRDVSSRTANDVKCWEMWPAEHQMMWRALRCGQQNSKWCDMLWDVASRTANYVTCFEMWPAEQQMMWRALRCVPPNSYTISIHVLKNTIPLLFAR